MLEMEGHMMWKIKKESSICALKDDPLSRSHLLSPCSHVPEGDSDRNLYAPLITSRCLQFGFYNITYEGPSLTNQNNRKLRV